MSVPGQNNVNLLRPDSHFLSATLSQCTFVVIEDLCRVVPAESWAPFQVCSCSMADVLALGQQQLTVLHSHW